MPWSMFPLGFYKPLQVYYQKKTQIKKRLNISAKTEIPRVFTDGNLEPKKKRFRGSANLVGSPIRWLQL